ncbi:hypothetical protein D9615_004782 [Tricholomella constricta]|uniref:Ketoreductase domain-containing protein n=1 Tax=Tricholomella constricta TaxID=117010 RepID=A0A8H5HH51_9AGAR|nr:hypothetical protein D9615_004782 [Tricholomella constricta]
MASESKGVAFVTGAAQGIGRAIALRLADDGYDMAINDLPRSRESLDQLSHEILDRFHKRKVCSVIGDVSDEGEVEAMIACVVEDLGRLDVMVANAGVILVKPMVETTLEDWERLFSVNVRGTFLCYKYAGLQMMAQGTGGRIIGASSVVGKQGEPNMSAYSASKFAVRGLTQVAARELGHHGITVNAYAPGAIDTPLLQNLSGNRTLFYDEVGPIGESKRAAVGHIGTPAEVASLVSYLVSKEAHFITGKSSISMSRPSEAEDRRAQGKVYRLTAGVSLIKQGRNFHMYILRFVFHQDFGTIQQILPSSRLLSTLTELSLDAVPYTPRYSRIRDLDFARDFFGPTAMASFTTSESPLPSLTTPDLLTMPQSDASWAKSVRAAEALSMVRDFPTMWARRGELPR